MKNGLTALEILVALAILALLATLSISSFDKIQRVVYLDGAVESVTSLIREARTKTLASEDFSQYGVYFESGRAVLFKGAEFSEGFPDNKTYVVPEKAEIINVSFPLSSVVFKKLTGDAEGIGDVSVKIKNSYNLKKISVNEVGLVYVE